MDKNGGPNQLEAWRKHRGLTQEQLAERLGTSGTQISMLESGERGLTAKWLRRLSKALDTPPGNILDRPPTEETAKISYIWDHIDEKDRATLVRVGEGLLGYKAG